MVFQHNRIVPLFKNRGNALAQGFTSRNFIGCHANFTAYLMGVWNDAGIGNFSYDAESHQGRRMGMQYSPDIRSLPVDKGVKG